MPDITLDGITLNEEEQRCVIIVWQANSVGIGPDFVEKYSELKPVAVRLSAPPYELMYQCRDDGYCLTKFGNWIGETLFDSEGLDFGDYLDKE